jgi:glycosyltransferase involved in cell wall biosynthesis
MAARKKAIKEYDWDVCAKRWLKLAKDWEKECA